MFDFIIRCGCFAVAFILLIYKTGWLQEFNTKVEKVLKLVVRK